MAFSLYSTPQQTPSLFQQQQQQQSSPFWPQQQQHQQQLFQPQQQPQQQQLFQLQQQPQQQHFQLLQQQQQPQLTTQQQQQLYLFTNEKAPASYGTKWAELHPDSQKILLQIEEKILEYRDESRRLDQCSRLYDSSVSSDGFEHDASHIIQELGGTTMAMERQKALLQELMTFVKEMLRNTEMVIRSFMILRQRYALSSTGTTSNPTAPSQMPGTASQQAASIIPVFDFYNGLPMKPSPFLLQTVARFEKYLVVCRQWVEELEQLLLLDSERNVASFGSSLVESLPRVMSNVHDFFVHVAAKVESIHQYIESMKSAYLADQRRRGDSNDPFLWADRREAARQEAAARRAHPTLHLPPVPQPSTQIAGLIPSSSAPATSGASQSSGAALSATSGSGFSSLFTTPTSSPAMPLSLFSTPSTFAPVSSLFGTTASAAATPQTALFSASSSSLFGSASAPSMFGTPAPSFGSTPQTGTSLFSTPFASGAATGSGASFGATKSSRPKSRTTRR